MTEQTYLGILTGMVLFITSLLSVVMNKLWNRIEEVVKEQKEVSKKHNEITHNYLTRFANLQHEFETRINTLTDVFNTRFDELRGVLDNHFFTKHSEVAKEIAELQGQLVENIRRQNNASADFYKEHSGALEWVHTEMEKSHRRGSKKDV